METLFSSAEKIMLLEYLFDNPQKEIKTREIARNLSVSPGFVSKTISMLKKNGSVIKNKADMSNPLNRAIKIFLNIKKIKEVKLLEKIKQLFPGFIGCGIYGSWSNGTNTLESDIDIWIKVKEKPKDEKILALRRFAKEKLACTANILVLDDHRAQELKEKDFVFYCSIVNSFLLQGEGF